MNYTAQAKQQFWVLILISLLFLLAAPSVWYYSPDSGWYVGTAESMVETGQYRFNGHPNLLYYPGFSFLLSLPIMLFGVNFHILHLFCAAMVVALIWLARAYFPSDHYGLTGIVVPVLMACTTLLQFQVFYILSDGTFLALSFAALLLWRIYAEESHYWALIACFVLVAFAPLVRFQGLFLCAAFGVALFLRAMGKDQRSVLTVTAAMTGGLATLIPFAAWTWRNVQQFTPDTFNMAHSFFFGQKGLALYAPEFCKVDWINAEWKYGIYNLAYSVRALGIVVFDNDLVQLLTTEFVFVFIVGLVFAGSFHWFKKATRMEQVYVVLSLGFLVWCLLRKQSLYVQERYWLPVLPFLLVSAGLGLSIVYNRLKKIRFHALSSVFIGFLVMLVLSSGVNDFLAFMSPSKSDYYRNANHVITKVKHFMDEKAILGVPVATTDWSVMPFALKRTCYQVLNDESHLLTLKRMDKYQTGYLVILDRMAAFHRSARKMVEELPQLFTLLIEIQSDGNGPDAAVYSVDLKGVHAFLNAAPSSEKQ